jgi:hypothetical protein
MFDAPCGLPSLPVVLFPRDGIYLAVHVVTVVKTATACMTRLLTALNRGGGRGSGHRACSGVGRRRAPPRAALDEHLAQGTSRPRMLGTVSTSAYLRAWEGRT